MSVFLRPLQNNSLTFFISTSETCTTQTRKHGVTSQISGKQREGNGWLNESRLVLFQDILTIYKLKALISFCIQSTKHLLLEEVWYCYHLDCILIPLCKFQFLGTSTSVPSQLSIIVFENIHPCQTMVTGISWQKTNSRIGAPSKDKLGQSWVSLKAEESGYEPFSVQPSKR